jgi:2-polyprenyl-3-methyl-5-hydroxy-6-metoxy-1,4-benzoquinol methylase
VGLAESDRSGARTPHAETRTATVVWHDLECGRYRADLPLWRELAEHASIDEPSARILDMGAGTGRVALELARAGHRVVALDLEARLLRALSERATRAGLKIETVRADARSFALDGGGDFALCVAPMQTVQLLGGSAGRTAFFQRAHAHLRPGALLACAIVTEIEPFDCAAGDLGPAAEVATIDGVEYVSRATSVHTRAKRIRIERERSILHLEQSTRAATPTRAAHAPEPERDAIELDRVSVRDLRREGLAAGLSYVETRLIPATDDHVGSEVVILRA